MSHLPAIFKVRIAADDPAALEVIFRGVVTIADLTDLSLTQDSGTPPTLESVTGSGSHEQRFGLDPAGSTLLRFACSAAIPADLHPTFVVGSTNTIVDLYGQRLAPVVVVVGEAPGGAPPEEPPADDGGVSTILTWSTFLDLGASGHMSAPPSSGQIDFALLAGVVALPGVVVVAYVPAGNATGWSFPQAVDQEGDGFDAAKDMYAFFEVLFDGTVLARTVAKAVADTTAPTISTATVEAAAPSNVVVTFPEAVTRRSSAGVSLLPWTSGTPKTITGVAGLGTTTHTYTTSAPVEEGDDFSITFDVDSTYQDRNGNALAPVVQAVTNNVAPSILARPALKNLWESTIGLTLSGSDLNAWTDQKSGVVIQKSSASGAVPVDNTSQNGTPRVLCNAAWMQTTTAVNLSTVPTVVLYAIVRDFAGSRHGGQIIAEHGTSFSTDYPAFAITNNAAPSTFVGGAAGFGGDGEIEDGSSSEIYGKWRIAKFVFDTTATSPNQVKVYVSNGSGGFVQKTSSPTAMTNSGNFASKVLYLASRNGGSAPSVSLGFQALAFFGFANTAAYTASQAADDAAVFGRWASVFGVS
ncbi:MAG TPA: hypothetical protein VK504_21110 [Vicinamibacterales bacterium]|nr:hypothetical protein [Vicinamibacterales bacterium]